MGDVKSRLIYLFERNHSSPEVGCHFHGSLLAYIFYFILILATGLTYITYLISRLCLRNKSPSLPSTNVYWFYQEQRLYQAHPFMQAWWPPCLLPILDDEDPWFVAEEKRRTWSFVRSSTILDVWVRRCSKYESHMW